MTDKTELVWLDISDPHYLQKDAALRTQEGIVYKIKENKRDTYSKVAFGSMLYLTLFLGMLFPMEEWIIYTLMVGIVIMLILLVIAIPFYKTRRELAAVRGKSIKNLERLGISVLNIN